MPSIHDTPPTRIVEELDLLKESLDQSIPSKRLDQNILIATWNIKMFGNLTKKWKSTTNDTPKRDYHSLLHIAEIVSRFDVVAIQEVKGNLRALRHLLKLLGDDWGVILTDINRSDTGNDERLAFVFDKRRVNLSGLACELVVPDDVDHIDNLVLEKQFFRTPYAVSFKAGNKTFILVTLHMAYTDRQQRADEVKGIAQWLSSWAKDLNSWGHNFIALGDFNIDKIDDDLYKAFISEGLFVHDDMKPLTRSIFNEDKFYDQIAWFNGDNGVPQISMEYLGGGNFDFMPIALKSRSTLTKTRKSFMISDHYPLWTEFSIL